MIMLDCGESSPRAKCIAVVAFVILGEILLGYVAPATAQTTSAPATRLADAVQPTTLLSGGAVECLQVTAALGMTAKNGAEFCLKAMTLEVKREVDVAEQARKAVPKPPTLIVDRNGWGTLNQGVVFGSNTWCNPGGGCGAQVSNPYAKHGYNVGY